MLILFEKIKSYLKNNRTKILLYSGIIALLASLFVITLFVVSLKVFLLIPLAILGGMGFVSCLKTIFPIKNILTFVILSLLIGLFINTVIIFCLGYLGFGIGYSFFSIYLMIIFLLNFLLYFLGIKENEVINYFENFKLDYVDIIWLGVLLVFTFVFINIAFENYFLGWDGFSFWAVDAKYIFENGAIRDGSFDILAGSYYSFYPLQLNYVYLLYNDLVEQHASILTLLYAFISVSLLYSYVISIRHSKLMKSFLFLIIIITLFTWFSINNVVFTLYSDVFCSTMALLYTIVLFKPVKGLRLSSYIGRFLLISLIAISFYLTKTGYSVVSLFFLGFYFLYDIKYIYEDILRKPKRVYIVGGVIALFLFGFLYLKNYTGDGGIIGYALKNASEIGGSRAKYFFDMFKFLFSEIHLFLLSTISFFITSFFLLEGLDWRKFKKVLFIILLASIPLVFYMIKMQTFADYSILRYLGLIYFAFPYVLFHLFPKSKIKSFKIELLGVLVMVLIPLTLCLSIARQWNVDFNFTPHTGSYKQDPNHMDKYYVYSMKIRDLVKNKSRILFVDEEFSSLGNSRAPSMFLRYFLSEYSVGRQYLTGVDTWYPFMKEVNPDYVVLLEYDGYWNACNNILEEDNLYLIKIVDGHKDLTDTDCFFEKEDVIKL